MLAPQLSVSAAIPSVTVYQFMTASLQKFGLKTMASTALRPLITAAELLMKTSKPLAGQASGTLELLTNVVQP